MNWLKGLKLVINLSKTSFIVFRPKRMANIDIDLGTNFKNIKRVGSAKYLGVILDEGLTWQHHTDYLVKKVNPIIGAIRRCSKFPIHIAHQVYNCHILSRIRSNLVIWSICKEECKNKIQVAMNRSLKALFGLDWYTPLVELVETLNTFTLNELIKIERCKFAFKIGNNKIKSSIKLNRHGELHRYPTRNRQNFATLKSNHDYLAKGIINSAINEFNNLTAEIKRISNLTKFNKDLKEYIRNSRVL